MEKLAVVTGGTKGIGWAISKLFAQRGYQVIAASRSGELSEKTSQVSGQKLDVRDLQSFRDFENTLRGRKVDVWLNCAGISVWKSLDKVTEEFWDDMIDTNLKGVFFGCQVASRLMQSGGAIINVSSLAGKRGSSNNSVYCASKFGVTGITQALAKELGPRGIRVNAVCPVYVETPMIFESLELPESPASGQPVRKYLEDFARTQSALQRLPLASEIAETCLFLTSSGASAITGQSINVDCGVMPQ